MEEVSLLESNASEFEKELRFFWSLSNLGLRECKNSSMDSGISKESSTYFFLVDFNGMVL